MESKNSPPTYPSPPSNHLPPPPPPLSPPPPPPHDQLTNSFVGNIGALSELDRMDVAPPTVHPQHLTID